ncbi:MAG: RNA polymerase sigma factor [Kiritimatiellia bacterium]
MKASSTFPETSVTLLGKLAAQVTGEDQSNWVRFWNLYAGAIRRFAVRVGDESHADDILSEVMRKLVDFFRAGRFRGEKGNFRAFVAQMVRNELGMAYRKEKARRMDRRVYLDAAAEDPAGNAACRAEMEIATPDDAVWKNLDLEWAAARRQEILARLLANPAIKPLYRDVYKAHAIDGRPVEEVARAFGITRNLVSQIKLRMTRAYHALAAELGDD